MKRIVLLVFSVCLLLAAAFVASLPIFGVDGNTVLVFRGKEQNERELAVEVTVEENSGVCAMLLSLEYDTSVLTLTGLTYGTAFSALDPIHTGTNTPEGYGVYPFQISYSGEQNDTSVGEMMTLHFRVKDNAPDGMYTITFSYERNKDVVYLQDGAILTKNLLIDGARITLKGNELLQIETLSSQNVSQQSTQKWRNVWLPIALGGGALACISIGTFLLRKKRKKEKKWIKL